MNEENEPTTPKETDPTQQPLEELESQANVELAEEVLEDSNDDIEEEINLDGLSLEALLDEAKKTIQLSPIKANARLRQIRPLFFSIFQEEKKAALESHDSKESEEDEKFTFEKDALADELSALIDASKASLTEEKDRIEKEKKKNLNAKKAILTELEEIIKNDETLETIKRVKEIQQEWKSIRAIPKAELSKLWERYRFLLDKFYDNHTINIDLKNLDRQKNLEAKIELTKKVELLVEEKSLRKCFIQLNKYHEEFKNIGPVPMDSREPIWNAFKTASDKVYEVKRGEFEVIESQQIENLEKKKLLIEKTSVLCQLTPTDLKGWNKTTKELEGLFEEWKKIGRVPKSNKDQAWKEFNGIRNEFYTARKAFFAELNKGRKANLILKQDLCKRVEALVDDTNWADTTKEIIAIQGEWKNIGPVPDRDNQTIWKRFRKACDTFFASKDKAFKGQREEEKKNLVEKDALLVKLEALSTQEGDEKKIFEDLREIGKVWKEIGYVPRKDVKRINNSYRQFNEVIYKRFNKAKESMKADQMLEHYQNLNSSPNAADMIRKEQNGIKRKINYLNDEILSIERNMSFFAKSSTADKMLKDFQSKINVNQKKITKLKQELNAIRQATAPPKEEPAPEESGEENTESESS